MSAGLKIKDLVWGRIYRSRISGLPVQVIMLTEEPAQRVQGETHGPFPIAWIRYYVPGLGQYMTDYNCYDEELEEME